MPARKWPRSQRIALSRKLRAMLLIGQFDSPFVRRVGIAMRHYALPFEHRPWSVWAHADQVAQYNPLRRVPVLVLDDGTSLVESSLILDALDDLVPSEHLLLPRSGPTRRAGLRICGFATGLADKAVSLFYEPLLRAQPSHVWIERCRTQVGATLDLLEHERHARPTPFWFGEALSHADIALACVLRFVREAHPGALDDARWPALATHSARCEQLPVFKDISQPFTVSMKE
jgi:glutathione S-transferase